MAKNESLGKARLLDHWTKPPQTGEPVGCVSTTFTFQSEFFEEECLSRFLGMETNAQEDGAAYIVEREEKLNSVSCAAVWVDISGVKQLRNLRWDLIPFHIPRGILHAKVSVLHWVGHLRLLISSANMTEEGYRKNQEVMVALDVTEDQYQDKAAVVSVLNELIRWVDEESWANSGVNRRSANFLRSALSFLGSLPDTQVNLKRSKYGCFPIFVRPGGTSFTDQVEALWREWVSTVGPSKVEVTSPFFDPPGGNDQPLERVVGVMRKRGEAELEITTSGEWSLAGKPERIHAPHSLVDTAKRTRSTLDVRFYVLNIQSEEKANRPIHRKSYWFSDDGSRFIYVIGSSNFTTRGLGLGNSPNVEANMAIIVDESADKNFAKSLEASWLVGEKVDPEKVAWEPIPDEDKAETVLISPLPLFFQEATIVKADGLRIRFGFSEAPAPEGFRISGPNDDLILNQSAWEAAGRPNQLEQSLPYKQPPSYLTVQWDGVGEPAILPVNLESQDCLPPPEELKNLPLDVLAQLITSARPIYSILKGYLEAKARDEHHVGMILDPLKRYDSSAFLLQRTRRYALLINKIRERLEQPFATASSLQWRIYGPVGIEATLEAMDREAKSDAEKIFIFTEIWNELGDIKPKEDRHSVKASEVLAEVMTLRARLRDCVASYWGVSNNEAIEKYSKQLFAKEGAGA